MKKFYLVCGCLSALLFTSAFISCGDGGNDTTENANQYGIEPCDRVVGNGNYVFHKTRRTERNQGTE